MVTFQAFMGKVLLWHVYMLLICVGAECQMSSDGSQVYFHKALVYFLNVSLKQSFNTCIDQSGIAPGYCGVASSMYMLLQPAGSLSQRKPLQVPLGAFYTLVSWSVLKEPNVSFFLCCQAWIPETGCLLH